MLIVLVLLQIENKIFIRFKSASSNKEIKEINKVINESERILNSLKVVENIEKYI